MNTYLILLLKNYFIQYPFGQFLLRFSRAIFWKSSKTSLGEDIMPPERPE